MKKIIKFNFILLSLLIIFSLSAKAINQEEIFRAMQDEITRTLAELHLESLQKPYYVEYTLLIENEYSAKAVLGHIVDSDINQIATISVSVRVGDYKFDNTNFFDFGLNLFGSGDDEERFKNRQVPLELDYSTLRRELWLATDAAYKRAAEIYSKKESSLKNKMRKDTIDDYTQIPPETYIQPKEYPIPSMNEIENICKNVSAVFRNYPDIFNSSAAYQFLPQTVYYLNSEGRKYVKNEMFAGLEVVAVSQAEDGMPLSNFYTVYGKVPTDLPNVDSLVRATDAMAKNTTNMLKADVLDDSYSGPIIFEGQAASEVFAQTFAPHLVAQRSPLTAQGVQTNEQYGAFQSKIGGRVLPEFLSVDAKPLQNKYRNITLIGSFNLDDEGILPQNVNLVKDGYLKNLLSSRTPIKRVRKSNGHFRMGAPMFGVLELTSDEKHSLSSKELKEKMLKLCKDRELPYGIIVRKAMNTNILFTGIYRLSAGDFAFGRQPNTIPLVEVYKVYPDGTEKLLRGCELKQITQQSFKDIINTSENSYVLNYLAPAVVSTFVSGGRAYLSTSIITPDLLFEDGEVKPIEDDFNKPPFLKNPLSIEK